jgi:hypothetical protein
MQTISRPRPSDDPVDILRDERGQPFGEVETRRRVATLLHAFHWTPEQILAKAPRLSLTEIKSIQGDATLRGEVMARGIPADLPIRFGNGLITR